MFFYKLYCYDSEILIVGDKKLNLNEEVQKALSEMSNDEILRPQEDWFYNVLDRVCKNTGFKEMKENAYCDVEIMYDNERAKREEDKVEQDLICK